MLTKYRPKARANRALMTAARGVRSDPLALFGADLTGWWESPYGVTVTGSGVSEWLDLGPAGHHGTQTDNARRPAYTAAVINFTGAAPRRHFDIATGTWPAHQSHSVFALVNVKATTVNQDLLDFENPRLQFQCYSASAGDGPGWYDGSFHAFSSEATGWQILEWHLDADATSGEILRAGVSLGIDTYAPRALAGTAKRLGSNIIGTTHFDSELGGIVLVSRATGHPVGVTNESERAAMRQYLQDLASYLNIGLAGPPEVAPQEGLQSDPFNGTELQSFWTERDPQDDCTVTVGSGVCAIDIPSGEHGLFTVNRDACRITQDVEDPSALDFSVEFSSVPAVETTQFLAAFAADQVHMLVISAFQNSGNEQKIIAYEVNSAEESDVFAFGDPSEDAIHLRITRNGTSWAFYYSDDGVDWVQHAAATKTIDVAMLGPGVGNTGSFPATSASIEAFTNHS